MSWKHEINIKPLFEAYDTGQLTVRQIGATVASMLLGISAIEEFPDDLVAVAVDFHHVTDLDDFNKLLDAVYDWGDLGERLQVLA